MKYLLLLLVLFASCRASKKTTETKTETKQEVKKTDTFNFQSFDKSVYYSVEFFPDVDTIVTFGGSVTLVTTDTTITVNPGKKKVKSIAVTRRNVEQAAARKVDSVANVTEVKQEKTEVKVKPAPFLTPWGWALIGLIIAGIILIYKKFVTLA